MPTPYTTTPAAEMTNTDRLVAATHALVQAERTGDEEAIKAATTLQAFYEKQVMAEGARERLALQGADEEVEAERQRNEIGATTTTL